MIMTRMIMTRITMMRRTGMKKTRMTGDLTREGLSLVNAVPVVVLVA